MYLCVPVCLHLYVCTYLCTCLSVFTDTCTKVASLPPSRPARPSRTSDRTKTLWVSLSVCLCTCVCTCLSLHLSVSVPVCVHSHLYERCLLAPFRTHPTFQDIIQNIDSVSLSVSVCLSTYLCVYLSVSAPVCLNLSAYLSVCVHLYLYQHGLCLLQKPPYLPGHHTEHRHCEYLCLSLSLYLSVYLCGPVCVHPPLYHPAIPALPLQGSPRLPEHHAWFRLCESVCLCVYLSVCMRSCVCSPHLVYAAVPASTGLASPSRSSYRIIINSVSLSVPVCIPVCVHPTWSTLLYQCGLYRACLTFQIIIQDNYKLCESLCTCLYTCLCSPHLVYTAVPVRPLPGWLHLPEHHTWYRLCETLLSVCVYTCLSVCIPIYVHPTWSTPCCTSMESQPIQLGEEASKKTEFEIACCGIDCIGEFLTQFWRRGRIERDGCQRGRHLYTACPAALSHRPVL